MSPYSGFTIPRKNKAPRPILSPDPRDRIIFTAILKKIEGNFSSLSELNILGSGTNKRLNNPKEIFHDILKHLPAYSFVMKVDIQDFFPSINKVKLLEKLDRTISDKRILNLIRASFYNPIHYFDEERDKKYFKDPAGDIGIPQGCAYSPLLANFYFSHIDRILNNKGFYSYRYFDDMLVLASSWEDANYIHSFISREAEKLDLKVHLLGGNKSYILSLRKPFEYLGIQVCNGQLLIPESQVGKFKEHIANQLVNRHLALTFGSEPLAAALFLYLRGWQEYYSKVALRDYQRKKVVINEWLFNRYNTVFSGTERATFLSGQAYFL